MRGKGLGWPGGLLGNFKNWKVNLEGESGYTGRLRKPDGREEQMDSSDGQMDGMGGWTVAMDRWTEREDGQTGGEDGMNQMDGNQMDAKAIGQKEWTEGQNGGWTDWRGTWADPDSWEK